jgi:hypothetical protein
MHDHVKQTRGHRQQKYCCRTGHGNSACEPIQLVSHNTSLGHTSTETKQLRFASHKRTHLGDIFLADRYSRGMRVNGSRGGLHPPPITVQNGSV